MQRTRRLNWLPVPLAALLLISASPPVQGAPAPAAPPAKKRASPVEKAPAPTAAPAKTRSAHAATAPLPAAPSGTRPRDPGWWHWTYLIDWGLMLGVAGGGAGFNYLKPHERSFSLDTPRIHGDFAEHETVPSIWLILTAALPLATVGLAQTAGFSGHDLHHSILGLGEALGVTLLVTGVLKASVGRLRPDFLDRCQPDANLHCTGDPEEVADGRRSFPSGHSSLSFAGATFMTLYLWGKLSPLGGFHWIWKVPTLLAPMALAGFVAWSRVHDDRHHWEDVTVGSLIGFGSAVLGYLLNYHLPWSKKAGQPRRRKKLTVVPSASHRHAGLAVAGVF